jgi:two-component system chemotaxis sensor kinase CheA
VLLFRGLDGARRALRLGVVDRIEEVDGEAIRHSAGQLRVQLGEAILPLAASTTEELEGKVRVFRLNDGSHELGYAFREVIDLMTSTATSSRPSPGDVGGVTLIDGEPAELIDAHWLLPSISALAAAPRPAGLPPARNDAWMQNMLRPIVEAAGYLVIGERTSLPPTSRSFRRHASRADRRPDSPPRHRSRCRRRRGQHLPLRPRRPADAPQGASAGRR